MQLYLPIRIVEYHNYTLLQCRDGLDAHTSQILADQGLFRHFTKLHSSKTLYMKCPLHKTQEFLGVHVQ